MIHRYRLFFHLLQWILHGLAGMLVIPLVVSWYLNDSLLSIFFVATLVTLFFAGVCLLLAGKGGGLSRYQSCLFLLVASFILSLFMALPYWFALPDHTLLEVWFESISGLTATGATVIADPALLPASLQLWRSLSQWFGGALFIIAAFWILPHLKIGGQSLRYEGTKGSSLKEKIVARGQLVPILGLYIFLTAMCAFAYVMSGLDAWRAINHAMTTISLGGFSTEAYSFSSFYHPSTSFVAMVFMLLACIPYASTLDSIFRNLVSEQFRALLLVTFAGMGLLLIINDAVAMRFFDRVFVEGFVFVSMVTGTGFRLSDYGTWDSLAVILVLFAMLVGGCSYSPASGIKVFRWVVACKLILNGIGLLKNERQVRQISYEGRTVAHDVGLAILVYLVFFFILLMIVTGLLLLLGLDPATAIGSAIATLSNTGPGLGLTGPFHHYADLSSWAQGTLCLAMLVGRLELFPALLLFIRA